MSAPAEHRTVAAGADHPGVVRCHAYVMTARVVVRGVIGAAAVVLMSACDTQQVSANARGGTVRDSADQVMFGGRSVLSSNGLRRADMLADTVLSLDAGTRFEILGVRTQFVTTLGRPLSLLTAPGATYHIVTGIIDTHGGVTIVSDTAQRRIDGVAVRYDISKDQLVSDSAFVATGGTRRLSGVGFTADPGLFNVKCAQSCTGSLGP